MQTLEEPCLTRGLFGPLRSIKTGPPLFPQYSPKHLDKSTHEYKNISYEIHENIKGGYPRVVQVGMACFHISKFAAGHSLTTMYFRDIALAGVCASGVQSAREGEEMKGGLFSAPLDGCRQQLGRAWLCRELTSMNSAHTVYLLRTWKKRTNTFASN